MLMLIKEKTFDTLDHSILWIKLRVNELNIEMGKIKATILALK